VNAWHDIMTAAQVLDEREDKSDVDQAMAWFLRREAGLAAYRFTELTAKGLPEEHALTLALDEAGYFVASSAAKDVIDRV
jgi:hypothetical protein